MKTKATKTSELIEVEDHFANRPQTKPSERISGRLLKWKDSDYVAFEPQKPRDTPARTILKEGKGKHQLCAFITIDSHLPREQMSGRLFRLCSEINKIIDSKKF